MTRRAFAALAAAAALAALTASPRSAAAREHKVIGVSLLSFQHQFFQELRAGLEAVDRLYACRHPALLGDWVRKAQAAQPRQPSDAELALLRQVRAAGGSITVSAPAFSRDLAVRCVPAQ